jgi:heme exporter protein D
MMDLGPHAAFIVGAYMTATAVVAALVVWVTADHAAQKRALAELERRGISRRSAESRPLQIKEPA